MSTHEQTPLKPLDKKIGYLAVVVVTIAKLGDSVELFIPSVITQKVTCELDLSEKQEHILALALYLSLSISTILSIFLANVLGRRSIIIFALYLSVIVSIAAAVVPNYSTLLLSRIAMGVSVGINITPISIYMAEICPDKAFLSFAITVTSLGYSFGGGWAGALGYILLEPLGWRWFMLVSSLPLFIPAIVAFHFWLPRTGSNKESQETETVDQISTSKMSMNLRIIKSVLYVTTRGVPYFGTILLLPKILQQHNILKNSSSPCHAIYGVQYLIIAAIFGASHLTGRFLGYIVHGKLSPGNILSAVSITNSILLGVMFYFLRNTIVALICMGLVQIFYSASDVEINILASDIFFFTPAMLAVSTGARFCSDSSLVIVANLISELLQTVTVLKIHIVLGIISIFCGLSFLSMKY